jgi:hypothetical protein
MRKKDPNSLVEKDGQMTQKVMDETSQMQANI